MKNNNQTDNSRQIAFNILKKVFLDNSFSNILLNNLVNNSDILQQQKNFIFVMVHGTITWKIYLEYITNNFIDFKKTSKEIQVLLWMSLYQAKFMNNIPDYAIVNEAVNIAKTMNPKLGKLVNGVLKNVLKDRENNLKVNIKNEEHRFCVEYAFPFKLYDKIKNDFGLVQAKRVVEDSINIPTIDFRVNTLKANIKDIYNEYKKEYGLKEIPGITDGLTAKKPVVSSQIYRDGEITIQDKASILVGQTLNPDKDSRVLDMCSAPGSKLTHLAAIMQNTGYIKALELNANRIKLIEDNLIRLGVNNVELLNDNALNVIDDNPYDFILLDAPCSGFGVLKRKPEIKLNIDWNYLEELYKLQKQLIEAAYKILKPKGILVYSTCTINKQEGQNRIEEFVKQHNDIKIISEEQLFGDEIQSDGFFIAKLQKD